MSRPITYFDPTEPQELTSWRNYMKQSLDLNPDSASGKSFLAKQERRGLVK